MVEMIAKSWYREVHYDPAMRDGSFGEPEAIGLEGIDIRQVRQFMEGQINMTSDFQDAKKIKMKNNNYAMRMVKFLSIMLVSNSSDAPQKLPKTLFAHSSEARKKTHTRLFSTTAMSESYR